MHVFLRLREGVWLSFERWLVGWMGVAWGGGGGQGWRVVGGI